MKRLLKPFYRWVVALLVAIATLVGIVGLQARPTQASLTLESAGLTLEEIADGVYGAIASTDFPSENPNAAICNGGIVIGSDSVLVVDPFQNKDLANLLFETVASLTDLPVRYVVNSHYHFDRSGGNGAATALNYPTSGLSVPSPVS